MASVAAPKPSKPSKSELDYRAEDDFRTLERAEEVRGDSQRHGRALDHGRKKIAAVGRVLGRAVKTGRQARRMAAR